MYLRGLDFDRQYSKRVSQLPLLQSESENGTYRLQANELEFVVRVAGLDNDGDHLILLHGFPETSIKWQPLLTMAADSGYRVLAFDQRGYSPGARPKGKESYKVEHLVNVNQSVFCSTLNDNFS